MTRLIHPVAGAVAILTIAIFWLSTAVGELFGSDAIVTTIKTSIPWGFLWLVPALMAAGGSGVTLARGRPRAGLVGTKIQRLRLTAVNGIVILIPSALFLASKARAGEFDTSFYAVQVLELMAGAVNITLLGLNFRDGLKMKGRFRGAIQAGRPATAAATPAAAALARSGPRAPDPDIEAPG
jgi:hypothetical protein